MEMSIGSSSNVSISNLRQSSINLNTATKAFENARKELTEAQLAQNEAFREEITSPTIQEELQEKAQKNNIDVEEIQKYANMVGESLSIDDINYGLMYGRSVIAEYIA